MWLVTYLNEVFGHFDLGLAVLVINVVGAVAPVLHYLAWGGGGAKRGKERRNERGEGEGEGGMRGKGGWMRMRRWLRR